MTEQTIAQYLKKAGIFQQELIDLLVKEGTIHHLPPQTPIITEGAFIKRISIVLDGEVRVWKNSEDGKQILLYYVQPVETCVMSLAATYRDKISLIDAQTTQETIALSFPTWGLDDWMRFEHWRKFVIFSFIHSYDDILKLYAEIAFNKLDQRIERYFNNYVERHQVPVIPLSHSQLAKEMGTSREVISRVLKNMEQEKKLKLGQKSIELL